MGADLAGAREAAVTDLAGEVVVTLLSVVVATDSADSTAAALVRDSGQRGDFLLVAFLVAEITVVFLATVVFVDASATFAVVAFAFLVETFSISASVGMDIRIITRTPTRITIRILIRTTRCIEGQGILGSTALLDQRRDSQLCDRIEQTEDINQ
jgi:hypothetical protein